MRRFFPISLTIAGLLSGCAHPRIAPERAVAVVDEAIAGSPYVQKMLTEVRTRWEEILRAQRNLPYPDQIVEITFQIDPATGQYLSLRKASGTSQLMAEMLCVRAIGTAGPFGEVPTEIHTDRATPLELTIRFHY